MAMIYDEVSVNLEQTEIPVRTSSLECLYEEEVQPQGYSRCGNGCPLHTVCRYCGACSCLNHAKGCLRAAAHDLEGSTGESDTDSETESPA